MCGIVGLFLKKEDLRPQLGTLLTDMLITMTDRGPDSAGIAIYGDEADGLKMTIQSDTPAQTFAGLDAALGAALGAPVTMSVMGLVCLRSWPLSLSASARGRHRSASSARPCRPP